MKTIKIKYVLIIVLIITLGCKDEFLLETDNYKPILVVDGLISNEKGPYIIKITQSTPVNEYGEIPFQGCKVTLFENSNKSEVLYENEPGIYVTSETGIHGVIGNEYRISIITPEGEEYNTEYQIIKEPVDIESIYAEEMVINKDGYPFGLPGYQFYTDTKTAPDQDNYFLWKMTESYQYNNDYELSRIYFGMEPLWINDSTWIPQEIINDTLFNIYKNNLYTCWNTQDINYIYTGKTTNLAIPKITQQPLIFVGTDSKRLTNRYSILLNQYTIGKEAYYFWEGIQEQSSQENLLVSTQPYNIKGNIINANNPNELIFGFFTVASVNQKRIFVDNPRKPFYYPYCNVITDEQAMYDRFLQRSPPFYYVKVSGTVEGMVDFNCIDCRKAGGTNIKPEFWIDK
ncbi:MAG: DUF4249 family protein [Bacteroidales bacterium]|nr:DUF4249 family protein [Bacteroidales bacterium]